jgi:hypothetical protein
MQPVSHPGDQLLCFIRQSHRLAYRPHIVESSLERMRVEVNDRGWGRPIAEHARQGIPCDGTDIAHRLADDQVRLEPLEERGIDRRGGRTRGTHGAIDFAGRLCAVYRCAGDAGQVTDDLHGIVALVRDSDQPLSGAQRGDDLRGGREQ